MSSGDRSDAPEISPATPAAGPGVPDLVKRNPEASKLVRAYRRAMPVAARKALADRISHDVRTQLLEAIAGAALRSRAERLRADIAVRTNPGLFRGADRRVVTVGGEIKVAYASPAPSPLQARSSNLTAVSDALAAAGVDYFCVRTKNDLAGAVAIPAAQRAAAQRALTDLCRRLPGYVGAVPAGADLPRFSEPAHRPGSWRKTAQARVIRLTWYHTNLPGGVVLGDEYGCDVEFWEERDGELHAPRGNRATAEVSVDGPVAEAPAALFTRLMAQDQPCAEVVRTRQEFAHPLPDDVRFPVDAVYTWVDGDDKAWKRLRDEYSGDLPEDRHEEADNDARYLNRDELRYSLRSLELNAPWIRTVYLVTADQTPAWLNTAHPRLKVISHRDIFSDAARQLPTFNSHAIESQLHHIEGLSEHFLYFNDDIFLGRPLTPNMFFHSNGLTKYFPSSALVPHGDRSPLDPPVASAGKNNRRIIEDAFGTTLIQKMKHVPHALRRTVLDEIEERYSPEHSATSAARFRSQDDVSIASSLAHYYGYHTGRAVPSQLEYQYIDLSHRNATRRLGRVLAGDGLDVFCINDTVSSASHLDAQTAVLTPFLEACFPLPSAFENDRG